MNRVVMLRIAGCGLLGLGAALLVAALLLSTYTAGHIKRIPLDIDTTLTSNGKGTVLDPDSLVTGEPFVIDKGVSVVAQQQLSVENPSDADVITLQVGSTLRRTDKQQDQGLLLAIVDSVTLDRSTAQAVSDDTNPGGFVQKPRTIDDMKPATNIPLPHEGLAYRFPFDTEQVTYSYFDPIAQHAYDANYKGSEDINGLSTYKFVQNIGYDDDKNLVEPIKYPSLYDNEEDTEVTARAALWGVEGDPEELITMTRYYAATRTFWVDPVSGTIVKSQEHANHYYARDPLKPEVILADYTVDSTEDTIEDQVSAARDERDRVALWSRILPISFTAAGLIALIGGALLASFSLRAEAAADGPHDPIEDTGPMPAAEAETEKLPAQRPDARPEQDPPNRT